MIVGEVLADTVSPMTSSAVCFGNGAMSHEVWLSKATERGKAIRSFESTTAAPVFV